jgi:RNase P/RNase MRP subunit p29
MRRSSILFNLLGAVGLVGLLIGCGSGGGGASTGTASGSASASGTVTGFGSVIVNGKKFEANDVFVEQDGESKQCSIGPNDTCGFKKGMQVTANGSFSGSQHTANSIRQKDAVEGLVQSVAADRSSLIVMGQTVLVDNTTIFDNNFTPTVGSFVEVNGHIQSNGVIEATFIEPKAPPAVVTPEVRGYVSSHVAASSTFHIGNLIVSYSGAITNDMPPGNWDGLFVEVKGANAAAFDSATITLTASKVEPEDRGIGNNVDEFEDEGFVRQASVANGIATFFVGMTEVRTTTSTEFREGTIDDIVDGAKVSVEGQSSSGILTAKHVKFKESARLEGDIENSAQNSFTIKGLQSITVTFNDQTRIENGPLQDGRHVRVRGRLTGANTIIATRIKVESPNSDIVLQGQVQEKMDNNLRILGVTVDTLKISDANFEDLDDLPIDRAAFLTAAQEGTLVKVKGRLDVGVVTWREAELED